MYLVHEYLPEMIGTSKPAVNGYARMGSETRLVFQFSELLFLFEVFNQIVGIQSMKRHIFIFNTWALFVTFCVIPFFDTVSDLDID